MHKTRFHMSQSRNGELKDEFLYFVPIHKELRKQIIANR